MFSVSVQFSGSVLSKSLQHHELQHAKPPCPSSTLRACECVLVAQSCPTLCNPMDCSQPGSSIYGIFQTRVLEWVAISFSIQLKLMSVELVMPSNHLMLCLPLLLLPSIFPSIRDFSSKSGGQSIGVSTSVSVLPMNI